MAYKVINNNIKKLIKLIENYNNHIRKRYLSKKYKDEFDKNIWATGLYFSIIDLIKNITAILDSGYNPVGVPILIRSCFDSYIHFLNVTDKKKYFRYMQHEKECSNQKINSISKHINDLKKSSIKQKKRLLCYLNELSLEKERLSEVEAKYLYENQKRKGISLQKDIDEFYGFLSDYVHCSHKAIMQWHIKKVNFCHQVCKSKKVDKSIIFFSLFFLLKTLYFFVVKFYCVNCGNEYDFNDIRIALIKCIKICANHIDK